MRLIYTLLCLFLLSSCVYYGTSRDVDFGDKPRNTCSNGSSKENKKCRAELRELNESIENRRQH